MTAARFVPKACRRSADRSEEHTSELQSLTNLVCRLLLEKKKNKKKKKMRRESTCARKTNKKPKIRLGRSTKTQQTLTKARCRCSVVNRHGEAAISRLLGK